MPSEIEGKTANKIVPRNCHVGESNEIETKNQTSFAFSGWQAGFALGVGHRCHEPFAVGQGPAEGHPRYKPPDLLQVTHGPHRRAGTHHETGPTLFETPSCYSVYIISGEIMPLFRFAYQTRRNLQINQQNFQKDPTVLTLSVLLDILIEN